MRARKLYILSLAFLFMLLLSRHCIANELNGSSWIMFFPNFGRDTLLAGFQEIEQNGFAIEGMFRTGATKPVRFNGVIKNMSNGFEFKIFIPSEPSNMVFRGKNSPITEAEYTPEDFYEKNAVNMLNSNGGTILYKITNGSVYSKIGFGPIKKNTFKNATGIVFLPKK